MRCINKNRAKQIDKKEKNIYSHTHKLNVYHLFKAYGQQFSKFNANSFVIKDIGDLKIYTLFEEPAGKHFCTLLSFNFI